MVLLKLIFSHVRVRKIHTLLTIAAVAISVSLVVAVTTGYASAMAAAEHFLNQYIGSADAQIERADDTRGGMPESLVDQLEKWPEIKRVTGRLEMDSPLVNAAGKAVMGWPAQVIGVRRPQDTSVDSLALVDGKFFDASDGNVAVLDQVAADKLHVSIGGTFGLPTPDKTLQMKVVGIVHKPDVLASAVQTAYVPLHTLQNFVAPGAPRQVTHISIELQRNADLPAFAAKARDFVIQQRLADPKNYPVLRVSTTEEDRATMNKNLQSVQILSYFGGAVSMLAATFIVFSALSMGVNERQRTLAMLCAIGATRGQIAGMVLLEGLALSSIASLLGALIGVGAAYLLKWRFDELFTQGVVISYGGIIFAAGGSMLAALAASLLPAISAARVSPLEAMVPLAEPPTGNAPWRWALAGLILVSLDPLLFFGPWQPLLARLGAHDPEALLRAIKLYLHFAIGLPGIMLGFFLLSPMFAWVAERVAGPLVAGIFGIRYALLRQQFGSGIWRVAGTCAALMVGFATLVAMQVQGQTLLAGWRLPDKFPDIFIVSEKFGGLDEAQQQKLSNVQGIVPGQVMPIVIAAPGLPADFFSIAGAALMPNSTMYFGFPPELAGKMIELEFRDDKGNPFSPDENATVSEHAMQLLAQGRYVLVTDEFRQLKHLKTGDSLTLIRSDGKPEDYKIAGVVWSPGIDVMVNIFDMGRQFHQRTAASVFGSLENAKQDFGVSGAYLFAANLEGGLDKTVLLHHLKHALGDLGLKLGDVRAIKSGIQTAFARLLLLASTVAFAAMAVASLGVTNTVMASVRSRRWQFGVLRSIGLTRGDLLRIILAEATLIGLIGIALGLCCGAVIAMDARTLATLIFGYNPPLTIPYKMISIGAAIVMAASLLASLWPAITTAAAKPLTLLQQGRAAS